MRVRFILYSNDSPTKPLHFRVSGAAATASSMSSHFHAVLNCIPRTPLGSSPILPDWDPGCCLVMVRSSSDCNASRSPSIAAIAKIIVTVGADAAAVANQGRRIVGKDHAIARRRVTVSLTLHLLLTMVLQLNLVRNDANSCGFDTICREISSFGSSSSSRGAIGGGKEQLVLSALRLQSSVGRLPVIPFGLSQQATQRLVFLVQSIHSIHEPIVAVFDPIQSLFIDQQQPIVRHSPKSMDGTTELGFLDFGEHNQISRRFHASHYCVGLYRFSLLKMFIICRVLDVYTRIVVGIRRIVSKENGCLERRAMTSIFLMAVSFSTG